MVCAALLAFPAIVMAQGDATFATRNMTVDTALVAVQAVLKK